MAREGAAEEEESREQSKALDFMNHRECIASHWRREEERGEEEREEGAPEDEVALLVGQLDEHLGFSQLAQPALLVLKLRIRLE